MNIDQYSRSQTAVFSFQLSAESDDSRRELFANSVHTADTDVTRRKITQQLSCVGVGGVYWV